MTILPAGRVMITLLILFLIALAVVAALYFFLAH